jgi:hypothetical protein
LVSIDVLAPTPLDQLLESELATPMNPPTCHKSMLNIRSIAALTALLVVSVLSLGTSSAKAATNQLSMFQDDGRLLSPDPAVREDALGKLQGLGVDTVKLTVSWRYHSPAYTSNHRPAGDTASTGYYDWGVVPGVLDSLKARGITPWIMVTQVGPDWASSDGPSKAQPGGYKPNPALFGDFALAAFNRFPDVPIFQVGNEPNFQLWLWPQITKRKVSFAAIHYRKMYIEAQDRILAQGLGSRELLFGALAPRAFRPTDGQRATQPARFLRDFFCLDDRLRPLKGSAARLRECTGKYKQIKATGFAYHPYTTGSGPRGRTSSPEDAPIGYMKRMYRILDRAAQLKLLKVKRIPAWNAEFAYESNPPDIQRTPLSKIPQYINETEYLSYLDRRMHAYAQYQLYDEPLDKSLPASDPKHYAGFQAGLLFVDGTPKGDVLNAYRLPLVVDRTKQSNKVNVWFGLRNKAIAPAPVAIIEFRKNGSGAWKKVATVNKLTRGRYATVKVRTAGASRGQYRVVSGELVSRTAVALPRPTARK